MKHKLKDAEELGVPYTYCHFDDSVITEEILKEIEFLNQDPDIKGIIVQLPLPDYLNTERILNAIDDNKDIDGFKVTSKYTPCTPKGIMTILDSLDMELSGKSAVIIGKGKTVGRPLINLLLDRSVTVTICHSRSSDDALMRAIRYSDIIISAVGKPHMVTKELMFDSDTISYMNNIESSVDNKLFYPLGYDAWMKERMNYYRDNKVVIDVGISRDEYGKQIGDCDKELRKYINHITGYTNAVGLMTRVSLFRNLLEE